MTLIFALLVIVTCFGLIASWVGANPGTVTMVWFGYQIETSVSVLILAALLIAVLVTAAYTLLYKLMLAPAHYAQRRNVKQYRVALTEITHSVAALAANDVNTAAKHTKKAERALGVTPLTLLLKAQISKSQSSDEQTRMLLEQLLEHPETEYLAAKSLADVAQKQQRMPQALNLAERAHKVNPKESHGAWTVFDLHLEAGQFPQALSHAQHARRTSAFSRADLATAEGKVALRQAEQLYTKGELQHALTLAQQAVKHMPGELAAAELCAKLYEENGQPQKALGIIQNQWKHQPSIVLAEMFREITLAEPPAKRQKLIEKMVASNEAAPENVELTR